MEDAAYGDALTWAQQSGILFTAVEITFRPDELISASDASDMLLRAVAAIGDTAKDIANGVLASYPGCRGKKDCVLLPSEVASLLSQMTQEDAEVLPCLCPVSSVSGGPPLLA